MPTHDVLSAWRDPASAMPMRAHFVRINRWSDRIGRFVK